MDNTVLINITSDPDVPKAKMHVCCICGGLAVSLVSDDENWVSWCEVGHVVVMSGNLVRPKMVFDFSE